jgi:Protein of unknown function (DUF5132)
VPKFRADVNVDGEAANSAVASAAEHDGPAASGQEDAGSDVSLGTTVATIGVIGVAAALIDVALIPGIIIGVAAAYVPKYVPGLGDRLQPLFNYTVRGAYKMTRSARGAVAEAQERMQDIAAEVAAEEAAETTKGAPARAAS